MLKSIFAGGRKPIDTFGKDPTRDAVCHMRKDRLEQKGIYHRRMAADLDPASSSFVDDITWNDMDMDAVFLRINHTGSFIGEQVLYHRLHCINTADGQYDRLERMAGTFSRDHVRRNKVWKKLRGIGKKDSAYYMTELMECFDPYSNFQMLFFRLLQLMLVISIAGLILTAGQIFKSLLIVTICMNLAVYMFEKRRTEMMQECLEQICAIIEICDSLRKKELLPSEWIDPDTLDAMKTLRGLRFCAGRFISKKLAVGIGLEGILSDYMLGITLWDLTFYNIIAGMISGNKAAIMRLYDFLGEIDMSISVASYRKSLKEYCIPVFAEGNTIETHDLVHPLVISPVANFIVLDHHSFLMGANASGKSTFLKALSVNMILAQTIHTCSAGSFISPRMRVMTSVAVRDDILSGESYYVREIRYLKRMIDAAADGRPVFCAVDEILKGTNKRERLAASEAVLKYLSDKNCIIIVATHDHELIDRMEGKFSCYHFKCILSDDGVQFDYRIHKGKGGETNAVALLKIFGFPRDVVEQANMRLEEVAL